MENEKWEQFCITDEELLSRYGVDINNPTYWEPGKGQPFDYLKNTVGYIHRTKQQYEDCFDAVYERPLPPLPTKTARQLAEEEVDGWFSEMECGVAA